MDNWIIAGVFCVLFSAIGHGFTVQKRYPHTQCTDNKEYNLLNAMLTHDTCMSADEVFRHLLTFTNTGGTSHCRTGIEKKFADKYPLGSNTPNNCTCTGINELHDYTSGGIHHHPSNCHSDKSYEELYNMFFHHGNNVAQPCRSHHTVWFAVSNTDYISGCQLDIIRHIGALFADHPDPCTCKLFNLFLKVSDGGSSCYDAHDMWRRLESLRKVAPDCMVVVDILAHNFGEPKTTACSCTGQMSGQSPFKAASHQTTYSRCSADPHYIALEHALFEGQYTCIDHRLMWTPLHLISQDCRTDFIQIAAAKFPNAYSDPCSCQHTTTTVAAPVISTMTTPTTTPTPTPPPSTTTTTTTTTLAPTTSTTTLATTPAYVPQTYRCKKFATVAAIANHDVITYGTANCTTGGSNEGFVLQECNVTKDTSQWHRGRQVMSQCGALPSYTPIAVFHPHYDTYVSAGAQSGIFAGCLYDGTRNTGFRFIVESCGDANGPTIVHIDGGVFLQDPNNYFVIN